MNKWHDWKINKYLKHQSKQYIEYDSCEMIPKIN